MKRSRWLIVAGLAAASLFAVQAPRDEVRQEVTDRWVNEASARINAVWGDSAASQENTARGFNAVWGDNAFWGNNGIWRHLLSALSSLRSLI